MPKKYKEIAVKIPVECFPIIDAFKNTYVGEKWEIVKLSSRGKKIKYIIEDWKKLKKVRINNV